MPLTDSAKQFIHDAVSREIDKAVREVGSHIRREFRRALGEDARRLLDEIRRDLGHLYGALLARAVSFPAPQPEPAKAGPASDVRHSPDFRSVYWHGNLYVLTPTQAAVVKHLWKAWQNGTPEVGWETLLRLAGSECGKLSSLFQGSDAWGTLVVAGSAKGTFRLSPPPG